MNGVLVSDFYTPQFFDPVAVSGVRYSYSGAIEKPRTILRGGYVTWVDVATNIWWQQTWFTGDAPDFRELGKMSLKHSLRSQIDRLPAKFTAAAIGSGGEAAMRAAHPLTSSDGGAEARAHALHALIGSLTADQAQA